MSAPVVSLKSLNLKVADGLDCPKGGLHDCIERHVQQVAVKGGGTVLCVKCRGMLDLVPVD